MEKTTKLQSVLKEKCPRCRNGNMFVSSRYAISRFTTMHSKCPNCGLYFEIEPGFYTGAMYISYVFSVAIFIITGFFLFLFMGDPGMLVYIATTLSIVIILFPLLYRYSRVIYLHLFGGVKFNPDYT